MDQNQRHQLNQLGQEVVVKMEVILISQTSWLMNDLDDNNEMMIIMK